ncbi:MAG: beta-galactosidase [Kiritimatiellales bacterium]|nr:beta-galactosidase [Kiritimatiellales bacterium]MCF7864310.1 beta-galactosidase [Kiritimatiellales bacterium]
MRHLKHIYIEKISAWPILAAACLLMATRGLCSDIVPVVLGGESQTNVLFSLAKDNFDRNDTDWQTSASSPNAIGLDWQVGTQSWKIIGNAATMQRVSGAGVLFWISDETANTQGRRFTLESETTLGVTNSTDFAGIAFNIQNATNYYTLRYSGTGTIQFLRIRNGATANLGSGSFAHTAGHAYRMVVSSSQSQSFDWNIFDTATGLAVASGSATDSGTGFSDGFGGGYASSSQALLDNFRLEVNEPLAVAKTIKGIPVLTQDSEIVPQDAFCANVYNNAITREEVRKAGSNSVDLVFARGLCVSVNTGDGAFVVNTATLDAGIQNILADNPDAQILLNAGGLHPPWAWHVYYGNATKLKDASGAFHAMPDPNSPIYLNAATNFLKGIVEHVEAQPYAASVVGYRIGLFEGSEFMLPAGYYGYSDASQAAFRDWIQQRYASIETLQTAWNDPTIGSFAVVTVPVVADFSASDWGPFRNPDTRRKVVDFTEFWQDADANCLLRLCQSVKDASSRSPLVGAFYGYMLETGQTFYKGHHALRKVLDSPHIDFLAAPYSYVYRSPAWLGVTNADIGAGAYHGPADSILSNGKIFFSEDDSRTYLTTDDAKSHFPDIAGTVANLRRNQLVNLCHGSGIWRLDLFGTGWYDSPELMLELGLQKHINALLIQEAGTDGNYTPDVALVIDEDSSFYVATRSDTNAGQKINISMFLRDHLQRAGINYGVYLLSDLVAGRVPNCSTYIFAGTYLMNRTERNWIGENLKKDGKTLVWLYGSGLYDETGWGLDRMASLMELDIAESSDPMSTGIEPTSVLTSAVANPPWDPTDLSGQPEWYVQNLPAGAQVMGNYVHGSTKRPAFVFADKGSWKTLYAGTLSLDQKWLLGLMRIIGVHQYVDTNATVPCYAGRGIIGIWPTEAMSGTIHLKELSDVYNLYSGSLLYQGVSNFPVNLAQWEVTGFKTQPAGSKWVPGLFYQWQLSHFPDGEITAGLADEKSDPDGDQSANFQEFIADTDPANSASVFKAKVHADTSGTGISFDTSAARNYSITTSTDLVAGVWMQLGGSIHGTGSIVSIADTNALPQAFYRAHAILP